MEKASKYWFLTTYDISAWKLDKIITLGLSNLKQYNILEMGSTYLDLSLSVPES